jgi:hypothetical protein
MQSDIAIVRGDTFVRTYRWESAEPVYRAITAITQAAPVAVTAPAHGLVAGWRAAVVSVKGMSDINAARTPPVASDFRRVAVTSANEITFPDVDASGFRAYTSGGYLLYYAPVDLTGYTARMLVKSRMGGEEYFDAAAGVVIDPVEQTVRLTISAADTASFTWRIGVYDLELESPTGVVSKLAAGAVTVAPEVTT